MRMRDDRPRRLWDRLVSIFVEKFVLPIANRRENVILLFRSFTLKKTSKTSEPTEHRRISTHADEPNENVEAFNGHLPDAAYTQWTASP